MAETKKRTRKPVKKTTAKKAEFETGEVILADELDELEKNDTVTVCSNFPRDIVYEVKDRAGRTVQGGWRASFGCLWHYHECT